MTPRIKWTDRTFEFNFPAGLHPEMIVRLAGSPARAENMVRGVSAEILTRREGGGWSMQENIGHLLDLEPLIDARLDQYEAGLATLKAADMANKQTHEAGHNDRPVGELLADFRQRRKAIIDRLERYPADFFARSAIHPRLNQPMRVVDLVWFSAEHDDYHLTRVWQLKRLFAP